MADANAFSRWCAALRLSRGASRSAGRKGVWRKLFWFSSRSFFTDIVTFFYIHSTKRFLGKSVGKFQVQAHYILCCKSAEGVRSFSFFYVPFTLIFYFLASFTLWHYCNTWYDMRGESIVLRNVFGWRCGSATQMEKNIYFALHCRRSKRLLKGWCTYLSLPDVDDHMITDSRTLSGKVTLCCGKRS